jgi:hypothetical protein
MERSVGGGFGLELANSPRRLFQCAPPYLSFAVRASVEQAQASFQLPF